MKFTKFLFAGAFCAGALATSLYAAECNYTPPARGTGSSGASFGYPATAIYLFEDSYLDLSKMNQREPAVRNVSDSDTAWVYKSELDSTLFVIVTEKFVKVARVAYSDNQDDFVDSLFNVHHDAVFKDEFARLQKAGVFKGTAEQADSLVNHVFELCSKFYCKEFGYTGCEYNPPYDRRHNQGLDIDMVDMPLALSAVAGEFSIFLDTLNFCPDYKYPPESTTIIPVADWRMATPKASFAKIGAGLYRIAGVKPGSTYKAFSLNGQLLKSGSLDGDVYAAPSLPIILMLNDGRSVYLKD